MASYSISRAMEADEVFVTPSTADATGDSIVLTVTASGTVTVLPQYSTDTGDTWTDHAGGAYNVVGTTVVKTITIPSGILRLTNTESAATAAATGYEALIVTSTTAESGIVTSDDVYRTSGITSTQVSVADVKLHILRAYGEARLATGRPPGTEQTTEYYWGNNKRALFLDRSPIITLDSLTIGTQDITTTYVDVVKDTGQIILKNTAETLKFTMPRNEVPPTDARNITTTYTWGYFAVPIWYNRLVELYAARMILTQQTGGTFDDVTSYTIGDVSASKGEPYTNIRQTVFYIDKEINEIILKYVRKAPAVF